MLTSFFYNLGKYIISSSKDLLPIIIVVAFFQGVIIGQALPDMFNIFVGLFWTLLGLSLFVYGLELALFPIGEYLAYAFVKQGRLLGLLSFSALLGFGTTIAEPALIAVAYKAAEIAQTGGVIDAHLVEGYAKALRYTVAISVAFSVVLGVVRIIRGWSLVVIITILYILVMVATLFAPSTIIGVAYDIGGVTTSTITVPLLTALGVGLASSISGRSPMRDGFGMIAIAAIVPVVSVLIFGTIYL